jgi:hypothetical protein
MAEVREHDQTSALAAAVERARIARDMHASVAHHLTVIVALSDGALASPAPPPRPPSDPGVSSTAREAPAGTRRLPGVLRTEGGLEPRQPIPGCPTLTACSPGSGRRGCRSGTNAAARPGTPRPASSWSSPGSFRKP